MGVVETLKQVTAAEDGNLRAERIRFMMLRIVHLIVFEFAICFVANGQDIIELRDSWEKIIILDNHTGWNSYSNVFEINCESMNLSPLDQPDSIVKVICNDEIDELLDAIAKAEGLMEDDPLRMFGRDSAWWVQNVERLWDEHDRSDRKRKKDQELSEFALSVLKDYERVKTIMEGMHGFRWTDDYPCVEVQIIGGTDTFHLVSMGQFPYMLPWYTSDAIFYSSKISETIARVLPDNVKSNKDRLSGRHFETVMMDELYYDFLYKEVEFIRARQRYNRRFIRIEKHFQIEEAEIASLGSIEWGGDFVSNCLMLVLKDTVISDQLLFSTVFGRRILPHALRPIIRKKQKLINQVSNNPVYQYALKTEGCTGEIHFVNRKSLSGEAKRNFLNHLEELGGSRSDYSGRFRNAIFFELTEKRNENESFSRWIFFADGAIVLWQLEGSYLMKLPDEYTSKEGFVCREIDEEVFNLKNNQEEQ